MEVTKIVTHLPPRHMDDFFAVSFLKMLFPEASLEFIHPQSVPEEYRENPRIILVDVGEDYNPDKNNYDHHQNPELECSLYLVLKHFSDEIDPNTSMVKIISYIDRFGFVSASSKFGITFSEEVDRMRRTILLADIKKYFLPVTKALLYFIEPNDYNGFIKSVYNYLDNLKILEEAKQIVLEEEKEFLKNLLHARIYCHGHINILVSQNSFAPYHFKVFEKLKVDVIVERNKFNPDHTSIIKNSRSPFYRAIKLENLMRFYPVVFIHKNGFIAVVNIPVDKIKPLELIEICTNS